jgi:hypothetical protein
MKPGDIHQATDASTGSENPRSVYCTRSSAGGRCRTTVSHATVTGTTAAGGPARAAAGQTPTGILIAGVPNPVGNPVAAPRPAGAGNIVRISTTARTAMQSRAIQNGMEAGIVLPALPGITNYRWNLAGIKPEVPANPALPGVSVKLRINLTKYI